MHVEYRTLVLILPLGVTGDAGDGSYGGGVGGVCVLRVVCVCVCVCVLGVVAGGCGGNTNGGRATMGVAGSKCACPSGPSQVHLICVCIETPIINQKWRLKVLFLIRDVCLQMGPAPVSVLGPICQQPYSQHDVHQGITKGC